MSPIFITLPGSKPKSETFTGEDGFVYLRVTDEEGHARIGRLADGGEIIFGEDDDA